jgi:hypothetical protein
MNLFKTACLSLIVLGHSHLYSKVIGKNVQYFTLDASGSITGSVSFDPYVGTPTCLITRNTDFLYIMGAPNTLAFFSLDAQGSPSFQGTVETLDINADVNSCMCFTDSENLYLANDTEIEHFIIDAGGMPTSMGGSGLGDRPPIYSLASNGTVALYASTYLSDSYYLPLDNFGDITLSYTITAPDLNSSTGIGVSGTSYLYIQNLGNESSGVLNFSI